ncbi:MAG: sigma-70 family RNA polymerase sigma factor [Planctomycetes bacterium]|nr:sigma-70 family RNA polymerase sigma factor [Planctomycetota bacterium]
MAPEQDPRELVDQASRGDAVAIDELLQKYLPGLQRYLHVHAGGAVRAKESSSDLMQSVCREVLERLGTDRFEYRGEAEFKQWLYQAALLKIKNRQRFYRAEKRDVHREVWPRESGTRDAEAFEALFRELATPSQDAMFREELERFESAFARLPENYQEVIHLAHFEKRSHREIAERLSVTEAHSRVLLSRALSRLAKLAVPDSREE